MLQADNKNDFNEIKSDFLLVVAFVSVYFFLFYLLFQTGLIRTGYNLNGNIHWDSEWYQSIANNGYKYIENESCNVAFFPFFPYLWKWIGGNILSAIVLNSTAIAIGSTIIFRIIHLTKLQKLYFLSLPLSVFYFVPYSEALFFLFSSIVLLGFKKSNYWLLFIGILGAGLTRSVLVMFVPAFLFVLVINFDKKTLKKTIFDSLLFYGTLALSLLIVLLLQWQHTDVWFAFSKVQKTWGHVLQTINKPLTSWSKDAFGFDILALAIGLYSGYLVLKIFLQKVKILKSNVEFSDPCFHFTISYNFCIALFILGFQGGSLHSIDRYILSTVFYIYFAYSIIKDKNAKKHLLSIITLSTILLFCSDLIINPNGFDLVQTKKTIMAFITYASIFLMFRPKTQTIWKIVFVFLNLFIQYNLLETFLRNGWIG